ncbi:MAG: hypothetical protein RBR67_01030 [Desulfobacterium sp.]|nr:hypothetical protein [Desulfobacterium sp.]
MEKPENNQRPQTRIAKREPIEPSDTGHLLEVLFQGRKYQFKVLNVSRGGIGMLVTKDQKETLTFLKPGSAMEMDYINPKGSLGIKVEIRHVALLETAPYAGEYCVGFSMSI